MSGIFLHKLCRHPQSNATRGVIVGWGSVCVTTQSNTIMYFYIPNTDSGNIFKADFYRPGLKKRKCIQERTVITLTQINGIISRLLTLNENHYPVNYIICGIYHYVWKDSIHFVMFSNYILALTTILLFRWNSHKLISIISRTIPLAYVPTTQWKILSLKRILQINWLSMGIEATIKPF